ncbi:MAG TPA: glycoside hydrolase family 88 protein [Verrucomicrobiae bacterium]
MFKPIWKAVFFSLGTLVLAGCVSSHPQPLGNLPPAADPRLVGERICTNLLARGIAKNNSGFIIYPEVCAGFGALRFAQAAGDRDLTQKLIQRYQFILTPTGAVAISHMRHVDFHVFGVLPLQLYRASGDARYRELGLAMADDQWVNPRPDGLCEETRFWVDDCFMIGALQTSAYRITHDAKYADRVALQLAAYLDKLQQPNGLFFHADVSPHYWGRGNGWFAVALAEVLSVLPPDHPRYARLMAGYRQMMASLKQYQAPSGLWHQLLDNPSAWDETSGSAMFTYGMIIGVKHGWLDESYAAAARRAWIGLCDKLDARAGLQDVCVGTNQKDDAQFYLDRPRKTGDLHGQSPMLWCAGALLTR